MATALFGNMLLFDVDMPTAPGEQRISEMPAGTDDAAASTKVAGTRPPTIPGATRGTGQ